MKYLIENSGGWVESPIDSRDLKDSDKIIASFKDTLFDTADEKIEMFIEFVHDQEGKSYLHYNGKQLKELYKMWIESLQR